MKKHFIYLTTNLITGEKYIGKHYGTEDDSYLGSGIILKKAIVKYGKENFKRNILYISKNAEENNQKEKEFIKTFNAIEDKTFYNIAGGGDGGDIFHTLPIKQQEQLRERARIQCTDKGNPMYGKHHTEETKEKLRQIDKSYTQTKEYRENMRKLKSNKIAQYTLDMKLIKIWDSSKDICDEWHYTRSVILSCCNKSKPHGYGYNWRYVDDNGNILESGYIKARKNKH